MQESGNKIDFTPTVSYWWQNGIPLGILFLLLVWFASAAAGEEAGSSNRPARYPEFQSALQTQMHPANHGRPADEADGPDYTVRIISALGVCGAFSLRLLMPRITKALNQKAMARAATTNSPGEKVKESVEQDFVAQFETTVNSQPENKAAADEARRAAVEEFYRTAPDFLDTLRSLFARISDSFPETARQENLKKLGLEVESLKTRLGTFDLVPAWQVASGIEKLIGQLAEKPVNITPSTLRTVAGGLLLLNDLCVPDIRKDLANVPPVRFLAVDDDPISRRAVSISLKKVAQAPDLAENGEAALELAGRQAYDTIFLDVEMPGLDGFEVCTKIHQLQPNRITPVVFVTSHSDFESRAKSSSSGGRDLIAKPFLTSEITLKALTLLLRGRLEREEASQEPSASVPSNQAIDSTAGEKNQRISLTIEEKQAVAGSEKRSESRNSPAQPELAENCNGEILPNVSAKSSPQPGRSAEEKSTSPSDGPGGSLSASPREFAEAFAVHGVAHLREMQKQVSDLDPAASEAERQDTLGELYVGLNMLRSEAARAGLKSVYELASGVGKLLSKLLEKPAMFTPSAQQAISAAIRLLEELAPGDIEPDFANPPIRALVVDDEPLTRRAISNALQLTFGKPDSAENGQAAVALTQNKAFDVIFLDIVMPEMDGFETCARIRETKLNGATPIIFVTSHKDTESRDKSFSCGGNGFISKPVLPAEIFLTALTFTLRARMGKGETVPAEQLQAALC